MIWKALDWIEPRYEVSDTGLVRSFLSPDGRTCTTALCMLLDTDRDGYHKVSLQTADGPKRYMVHRLVLRAFTGVEGPQGNHKNGVRHDNRLENLAWVTCSENILHAFRVLGKKPPKGMLGRVNERNANSAPVMQYTPDGMPVRRWPSMSEASRAGYTGVSAACRGIKPYHAGFKWSYV